MAEDRSRLSPGEQVSELRDRIGELLSGPEFAGIVAAYLFGSFAEDRAHRESDVDLGVLLKPGLHTREQRFNLRILLSSRLSAVAGDRAVDVVIVNDAPAQFARRIVTRGRRLFCLDPAEEHAFVRDVQLRAADLEPFLRKMRRIKLEALARS